MTSPLLQGDVRDVEEVNEALAAATWFAELGTTGLKRSGGYIDEEFLPALRGRKAIQVYREMQDNDAIIGALVFAIQQLLRGVDFPVVPAGKSRDHANAAKLLETCMDDMSHTFDEFIVECLSHLWFGWAWHEIVFKRRGGPWAKDGRQRSKYTDGLVGIRRLPIRSQETLQRWVFDETGGVRGMVQLAPPDYQQRVLPIERSLLFRHGAHKGNPEGRSMLRNAYRSWFYKKRLEEFEAVGVERDLAGLPMASVPADHLRARPGTDQYKTVEAMKKMVRSVRRNEQEGLVFPVSYDPETKQPKYKFELLGSGGARQFSTNELIQRYEQRMLMTVLADFILVGHESSGTYNLHVDKTGIFRAALTAITDSIAETLNRYLVPRLFAANGWKPAELPKFQPNNVDRPDLAQLSGFLAQTSQLGFNWGPDADMERFLRESAGLPELSEEAYEKRRVVARRAESTLALTTQTEYLAAQSELAQMMAQQQMLRAGEPTPEEAQTQAQAEQAAQQQAMAGQQAQFQQEQASQQGQLQQMQAADQMATSAAQRMAMLQGPAGTNGPTAGAGAGPRPARKPAVAR